MATVRLPRTTWLTSSTARPMAPAAASAARACASAAFTSTPPKDGAGARAQVVRRQPDGSWLRILDQPELTTP